MNKDQVEITVSLGRTINMGNYESARIDVSMRMICDEKETEEQYTWAYNWCDSKITEELDVLEEERSPKRGRGR